MEAESDFPGTDPGRGYPGGYQTDHPIRVEQKIKSGRELLLGIDSSTTGCKAIAWDLEGNLAAEGRAVTPTTSPNPGWYEQPASAWQQAMLNAIRQVIQQVDASRIQGLCIAHQRETFVAVGIDGNPLRPAILWMDERAKDLLPELRARFGEQRFHHITGKPLFANLTVCKLEWLRRFEPQVFAKAGYFLDVHAYLVHALTGQHVTSWGSAGPTGLFDLPMGCWSEEILAGIQLTKERLPDTQPPGSLLGGLTPEAAEATGLPSGLPVLAGLGDGQAAGLGSGVTTAGPAYLSLGTSVIGGMHASRYVVNPAFRSMVSGVAGSFFLETALMGGTYTIDWFLRNYGRLYQGGIDQVEAEAGQIPAGSQGLVLVPYWNSVMNPYWDELASGIVIGWRDKHSPAHLYRAILEGIAFELRLQAEGVAAATGQKVEQYRVSGGGARSSLWRQIIADVTGTPLWRIQTDQAAALGAGILAGVGLGFEESADRLAKQMVKLRAVEKQGFAGYPEIQTPDANRHAYYTEIYEQVYRGLYPAMKPFFKHLGRR